MDKSTDIEFFHVYEGVDENGDIGDNYSSYSAEIHKYHGLIHNRD